MTGFTKKRICLLRKIVFLQAVMALLLAQAAYAGQLVLPAAVNSIEEGAFENDTNLEEVILPDGLEAIGSRAFADSSAHKINLPGSLENIADNAFDGVSGLDAAAKSGTYAYLWAKNHGLIVNGTVIHTDCVSVQLESHHLTVNVRGMTRAARDALLQEMEDNIQATLENQTTLKITLEELTDAEKYDNELKGYDALLCWAATAANMLWTSDYAQQAVNPYTGDTFQSVDEVFDYFRQVFTDQVGRPDGAVSVFLNGDYPFTEYDGWSQLRDSGSVSGLIPEIENDGGVTFQATEMSKKDGEQIRLFEKLTDYSMGVLIRQVFNEGPYSYYYGMSHWVTAVGIIFDDSHEIENLADRYKAIILANSDDDSVNGLYNMPSEEKAAKAAAAANSYTVYPMKWKYYGETVGYRWTLSSYFPNSPLYEAVIDWMAYLIDKAAYEGNVAGW